MPNIKEEKNNSQNSQGSDFVEAQKQDIQNRGLTNPEGRYLTKDNFILNYKILCFTEFQQNVSKDGKEYQKQFTLYNQSDKDKPSIFDEKKQITEDEIEIYKNNPGILFKTIKIGDKYTTAFCELVKNVRSDKIIELLFESKHNNQKDKQENKQDKQDNQENGQANKLKLYLRENPEHIRYAVISLEGNEDAVKIKKAEAIRSMLIYDDMDSKKSKEIKEEYYNGMFLRAARNGGSLEDVWNEAKAKNITINVNSFDSKGKTAAALLAESKRDTENIKESLKFLLSKGANLNLQDYKGRSAADMLIKRGKLKEKDFPGIYRKVLISFLKKPLAAEDRNNFYKFLETCGVTPESEFLKDVKVLNKKSIKTLKKALFKGESKIHIFNQENQKDKSDIDPDKNIVTFLTDNENKQLAEDALKLMLRLTTDPLHPDILKDIFKTDSMERYFNIAGKLEVLDKEIMVDFDPKTLGLDDKSDEDQAKCIEALIKGLLDLKAHRVFFSSEWKELLEESGNQTIECEDSTRASKETTTKFTEENPSTKPADAAKIFDSWYKEKVENGEIIPKFTFSLCKIKPVNEDSSHKESKNNLKEDTFPKKSRLLSAKKAENSGLTTNNQENMDPNSSAKGKDQKPGNLENTSFSKFFGAKSRKNVVAK